MVQSTNRIPLDDAKVQQRPVTELMRELRDDALTLVRQEVDLARVELSEKASRVARHSGYLAIGGLIAYAGLHFLLLSAVVGLYLALVINGMSRADSGWLSPLIVGGILGAIGTVLVAKAVATLKSEPLLPRRTIESLKEDKAWAKEKVAP
jgi:hypothetical protein